MNSTKLLPFDLELAVEFLIEKPGYLKKGDRVCEKRTGIPERFWKRAKEIARGVMEDSDSESPSYNNQDNVNINENSHFQKYIEEVGIDPNDIVSVKYWQTANGDIRYSVVTKDSQKDSIDYDSIKEDLLNDIRRQSPTINYPKREQEDEDALAVLNIPDLHIGKKADHWDPADIADTVLSITDELLEYMKIHKVNKIVLPLGHDILQVDNYLSGPEGSYMTTTSGTKVESQMTKHEMFRAARWIGSLLIRALSSVADVHVIIVPSNHSYSADLALGEVWDAEFFKDSRITIDNKEEHHKAFQWGNVGLLFTHGHTVKFDNLPMLFATTEPEIWGSTKYREVLTGHYHISKGRSIGDYEEMQGATVRISPSLSPSDSFHKKNGYNSIRGVELFVYSKDRGLLAMYSRKILD